MTPYSLVCLRRTASSSGPTCTSFLARSLGSIDNATSASSGICSPARKRHPTRQHANRSSYHTFVPATAFPPRGVSCVHSGGSGLLPSRLAGGGERGDRNLARQQKRFLNLHEHQSLSLMKQAGLTTQKGAVAYSPEEAREVAERLVAESPGCDLIVKAQIHAGGRGKGKFDNGFQGGVQILKDPADVEKAAHKMLGFNLVTKQTGPEGQPCNALLINEGINIEDEFYLAMLLDREAGGPVIVASSQGGMDIEEVAESDPDAIMVVPVDINGGVTEEQADAVATKALGLMDENLKSQAVAQIKSMGQMLFERDATQIEVNPFALADDGLLYCVDAKLNFDDCARYRQLDVFKMRDISMEDPRDVRAEKSNLNYIGLDGSIGCMVNGAGLAMATMDLIQLSGGRPANFLDVGGGASKEQVSEAFKILTADPHVKGLLVNIFGGIMKCDVIAQGIIAAHREVGLEVPLVVRLEGTNVDEGKELLKNSGLPIITADDLDDAAQKAVDAVKNLGSVVA